jgi:dihydroorotate dehydrogenase
MDLIHSPELMGVNMVLFEDEKEKIIDFGHSLIAKFPPEISHKLAIFGMLNKFFSSGEYIPNNGKVKFLDVELNNGFGIGAGFDKYAKLPMVVRDYGFGFIETGSFTYRGGKGNEKPRLFRLSGDWKDGNMLNRMGLNNCSSEIARERLKYCNKDSFAVNIAKTHNPSINGDKAIEDILSSYLLLADLGIYTMINISCPNTKEGKTFEEPKALEELLSELHKNKSDILGARPLGIKLSPGHSEDWLAKILYVAEPFVDLYEAVNTEPYVHSDYGKGGLSGPILRNEAIRTIKLIKKNSNKPIIGVGGVSTGKDAYNLNKAGADLFLAYTGFVYKNKEHPNAGAHFAYRINKEFEMLNYFGVI